MRSRDALTNQIMIGKMYMFGYDANAFGEQSNMHDTYSQAGPSVEQQARMLAHKNPEGVELVMKAMNRDYSQLVKKFKK